MITTSRSAVATYQSCNRKRYWMYEASNGTATPGWERRKLTIPLVTGIYVHKGLEEALKGASPSSAASHARESYLAEVTSRGLAVEEGTDEQAVIDEQAAHVEALVLAWCRVRLPRWLEEYEIVEVEVEDRVPLSDDVTLAVRADAIVRRKADHRMFVVNFKTVATADERWLKSWEVDMQLMTELLAAERRHGQQFGGVIIEGLSKGRRMPEKDIEGEIYAYRDSTPLLYGYKCDADPPLVPLQYQHDYTRRKGWYRFATWKENFPRLSSEHEPTDVATSLQYWINWLPEEVVEAQFCIVPPIMRDQARIDSKVRQIVAMERDIQSGLADLCDARELQAEDPDAELAMLDANFPQNEHSCIYPGPCACYSLCYTNGVASDPAGSGLYQIRTDHHAPVKETV